VCHAPVLSLFAFVKEGDVAVLEEFTVYNHPLSSDELKIEYGRLAAHRSWSPPSVRHGRPAGPRSVPFECTLKGE
jgi:hypothetical protein